jgi:hypothetical protein
LLKRREGELFTEHRWTWLGPLVDAAKTWTFERGMVQITAEAEKLLIPEVTAWARSEAALWIDALALTDITPAHTIHLAYSPLFAHVNRLDLSGNANLIGPVVFFRALRAQSLPFLTQLLLSRNRLVTDQILALARCRHCRQLHLLDLQHNRLDDDAARILVESPHLTNGTILYLGRNRFTADGIALLREAFGERVFF